MKKILIAAAVGMLVAGHVAAQESPWLVRARVVNLQMANDTTGTVNALDVNVNDKTIPEVDITYFINKNVAAELILTVPQSQTVYAGSASLGTFKHLPPTLTLQYHFTDLGAYKPYVGAGLNYTKISGVDLKNGSTVLQLDSHSYGAALQAGVDIPLDKQWSLNFDVKKVYIKTDVYAAGASLGTLKLDPVLVGVGVGYRF
ncbi:OmpW/AlkL family protein [Limnohabitans sp.]|uniref:OmpW/AlkL family protein n=1 Tax=Limnohabitans sp. TaxID=1907725 RepID=UPI0038B73125